MRIWESFRISRRSLLAAASASLVGCKISPTKPEAPATCVKPDRECRFRLYRAEDKFSCELIVIGFKVRRRSDEMVLIALPEACEDLLLIFEFPPQHNAETALERNAIEPVQGESFEASAKRVSDALSEVGYHSSQKAQLVFRVPRDLKALPINGRAMKLSLEHLLAWENFEYIREDAKDPYGPYAVSKSGVVQAPKEDPDPSKRYLLGLEDWKGTKTERVSAIDLPTGFYLQPRGDETFEWRMRPAGRQAGDYWESWSAFMVGSGLSSKQIPSVQLELVDIHGVAGGHSNNTHQRHYVADPYQQKLYASTPIDLFDRMELAVTLSPRFAKDAPEVSVTYSEDGDGGKAYPFAACFIGIDHVLTATTYGIGAEGGFLDFEGTWSVRPGCAIKGWVHKTHSGRDTFVKVTRKGWLNLHGFELELINETERTYLRDQDHRLVAPLVKQTYIRVVQPAYVQAASPEEAFTRIDLLTLRTPPLDAYVDPNGTSVDLEKLDAFIPHVDGKPFEWEFRGVDHAGNKITWTQPAFFLSNRQTYDGDAGRFPENKHSCVPPNNFGGELQYIRVSPSCSDGSPIQSPAAHVPNFIKLVDVCWSKLPYRFGELQGAAVAIAPHAKSGDTTIEVKWLEWVRGVRPEPLPPELRAEREAVVRPIRSRVRTARFALPTLRQFAGQVPDMLGTFRDLRPPCTGVTPWSLDPEETDSYDVFHRGVLQPGAAENASGAYLYVLPTEAPSQAELLRVYFQSFTPTDEYARLFDSLKSGVSFGKAKTTEGLGGLATPDCSVALLTRNFGPVGDSKQDFASVSGCLPAAIPTVQGGPLRFAAAASDSTPGLIKLGVEQLFGDDAEILPGVKFTKVLDFVFASGGDSQQFADQPNARSDTLQWQTRIVGLEWLTNLFATLDSIELSDFIQAVAKQGPSREAADPIRIGVESTLNWSTTDFKQPDPNEKAVFKFIPKLSNGDGARFEIAARAWLDALDPKPELNADCRLSSFALEFFNAIKVNFNYVHFSLDAAGNKRFDPAISDVTFSGPLAFLDLLKQLLSKLGDKYGIKISISPQRAMVSQVLSFPLDGSGVIWLGPAAIRNLSFQWGVIIPILGRDRTRIFVGLASRESPMTISVGIYGGRAYALVEADTSGPRLIEISADYGGVLQAAWGVAQGSVSLTAGFTFTWMTAPSEKIKLFAFAQFSGCLSIARIFSLCANIIVSLGYVDDDEGGDEIIGIAECRCSFSLGITDYSYSYTAQRREKAGPSGGANVGFMRYQEMLPALAFAAADTESRAPPRRDECAPPERGEPPDAFLPLEDLDEWANYFSASV